VARLRFVTLWLCDFVTLLLSHFVTLSFWDFVTLWLRKFITFSLCDFVTLWLRQFVTFSLCDFVTLWFSHFVTVILLFCDFVTSSVCQFLTLWLREFVTFPLGYFVTFFVSLWLCDSLNMSLCDFVSLSVCHFVTPFASRRNFHSFWVSRKWSGHQTLFLFVELSFTVDERFVSFCHCYICLWARNATGLKNCHLQKCKHTFLLVKQSLNFLHCNVPPSCLWKPLVTRKMTCCYQLDRQRSTEMGHVIQWTGCNLGKWGKAFVIILKAMRFLNQQVIPDSNSVRNMKLNSGMLFRRPHFLCTWDIELWEINSAVQKFPD
jgi:hypothetical protein